LVSRSMVIYINGYIISLYSKIIMMLYETVSQCVDREHCTCWWQVVLI
jgi:hypothetical protein